MTKFVKISFLVATLALFSGCGGSTSRDDGASMSSDSGERGMGSLSGEEEKKSLATILSESKWKKIDIDLDMYRYLRDSGMQSYDMDMSFGKGKVTGLADCNRFSANYKVKDDELSFSRVHFELATDLASCKGAVDADEAVNSFLSATYTLVGSSSSKIILESLDIDTSIILTH